MDGFFESTNTLSDAKLEVDHYVEFAQHEVTHSLNQLMSQ
jgi:hypothetical protein